MPISLESPRFAQQSATVFHPISVADKTAMAAMRAIVEPNKGRLQGTAARVPFDAIMERVAVPEGVTFEAGTVGGIPGWWCKPQAAQPRAVVLHIHGGWFNWGSAKAFRNLVGHFALHAGAVAFAPEYRLAPEHPFPAAAEDVRASYFGLLELGYKKIAVTGDSAGGNLASRTSHLTESVSVKQSRSSHRRSRIVPSDGSLALWVELDDARGSGPLLHPISGGRTNTVSYLNGADPSNPSASPLHADLVGLAPIRIHVGDDEVLLEDSIRFVDRALAARVDAQLDVWEGMVHGFPGSVGLLNASTQALQ